MYDDFDYALEDAFDEGYYQALIDMGIDPDDITDIAEEDVDMFDDDYFEGVEGAARDYRRAQNAGKTRDQIQVERYASQTPIDRGITHYSGRHGYNGRAMRNISSKYNQGDTRSRHFEDGYEPTTKGMKALKQRMENDPEEARRIGRKVDAHFNRMAKINDEAVRKYRQTGDERYLHR